MILDAVAVESRNHWILLWYILDPDFYARDFLCRRSSDCDCCSDWKFARPPDLWVKVALLDSIDYSPRAYQDSQVYISILFCICFSWSYRILHALACKSSKSNRIAWRTQCKIYLSFEICNITRSQQRPKDEAIN